MYYNLIKNYILKMSENDIKVYAFNNGIDLNDKELKYIYNIIKDKWEILYYDKPNNIFDELKLNVRSNAYDDIVNLYNKYKQKIL